MQAHGAQCAAAPKGHSAGNGGAVDESRREGGGRKRLRVQFQLSLQGERPGRGCDSMRGAARKWRIDVVNCAKLLGIATDNFVYGRGTRAVCCGRETKIESGAGGARGGTDAGTKSSSA